MSKHYTLRGDVGTVHRGVFDASIKPVLRIGSGDTVEVTTLSGNDEPPPSPDSEFVVSLEHRGVPSSVALTSA